LGLPFLLFFPGYTLVAALFVKNEGMDNIERVVLSGGMSVAVVGLIGFGLNYTPWGIKLEPVLYTITAFIFMTSFFALIRRAHRITTNKFTTEVTLSLPVCTGITFNKSLSIILIFAIFFAFVILGYTVAVPKIGERFTDFYILGVNGKAQDYPTEYVMNDGMVTQVIYGDGTVDANHPLGTVTLGIVNHEHQTEVYSVNMTIDGKPVSIEILGRINDSLRPIELKEGEKWENEIEIIPQNSGDNQKVELLLFKGIETTAENSLHFWINVK
jgi:uncharacterized membrane protein